MVRAGAIHQNKEYIQAQREYYTPDEIEEVINTWAINAPLTKRKDILYYEIPCAFDIETSSFYDNGEKRAIMYEWTLGINGVPIIGRTWAEFETCIYRAAELLGCSSRKILIIYVHNLAYEFQFIRKRFTWDNVFSISERHPACALTDFGVLFKCSYILSGYSLENLAKNLHWYKVTKRVGDLDYTKIRHSTTPLTEQEIGYCISDVDIVMCYISECMRERGSITNILLTKTGYVREFCKQQCLYNGDVRQTKDNKQSYYRYRRKIKNMRLSVDEYATLKRAFCGGFTHAAAHNVGKAIQDVASYDFTSSYPAVLVAEQYPMGRAEYLDSLDDELFQRSIDYYSCLFDVEFINLHPRIESEHILSGSKCFLLEGGIMDNGRVVYADRCRTTVTDVDYKQLERFYNWDECIISNFYRYHRDYLPTEFVKSVLKLYGDKTTLKGVAGQEVNYLRSKEMLNSCYGMCVTDIVRDETIYNDDWVTDLKSPAEAEQYRIDMLTKYNNNPLRFLSYQWGVWCTAYARANLYTAIEALGDDYLYSDTDSVKVRNPGKHLQYFERYNDTITSKLEAALEYHGLHSDLIRPKNSKGVEKPLGIWDYEGTYEMFKTLGAKRYLTVKDRELQLTVAGLGKKTGAEFLMELAGNDVKNAVSLFADGLIFPKGCTGKQTHTFIDIETAGHVTDFNGVTAHYHEYTSLHLEDAGYELGIGQTFRDFLITLGVIL